MTKIDQVLHFWAVSQTTEDFKQRKLKPISVKSFYLLVTHGAAMCSLSQVWEAQVPSGDFKCVLLCNIKLAPWIFEHWGQLEHRNSDIPFLRCIKQNQQRPHLNTGHIFMNVNLCSNKQEETDDVATANKQNDRIVQRSTTSIFICLSPAGLRGQ